MRRSGSGAAALRAASARHPPLPVKLSLQLGAGVMLHSDLAAALLQELLKFIQFARGQTQTPFEHLRAALQGSLQALAEQQEQEQTQAPQQGPHGAGARPARPRRSRRLRLPSSVTRLIKFSQSMDALLAAASPQLLTAAQPAAVAVMLGACPHRPRELYHITFSGPDGQPLLPLLPPSAVSLPPPPTPVAPLPPVFGTPALASGSSAAAATAAGAGVTAGGCGAPTPQPPPVPQGQLQHHAAEQPAPWRGTRRQAPRSLGPDAAAAVQAGLSERERGAVRRALRGLVVAQSSVEAWSRLQRPTWMWLAVAPSAATAASTSGAVAQGATTAPPAALAVGAMGHATGGAAAALPVPPLLPPPPPPAPPPGSGFRMCTRLPFVAGAASAAAAGASAATTAAGATRALRKTLQQVHIDIQASCSGTGAGAAGVTACGKGAGALPQPRQAAHGSGPQGAGMGGLGAADAGGGAPGPRGPWAGRQAAAGGGRVHGADADADALVSLQLATSKLRLSQSPAVAAGPVASTAAAAGPHRSSAGRDRSYSHESYEAAAPAAAAQEDGGLEPRLHAGAAPVMATPQSKQRRRDGSPAAEIRLGEDAGAKPCDGIRAGRPGYSAGAAAGAAAATTMEQQAAPGEPRQPPLASQPAPIVGAASPAVWWLCSTSVRSVVKPEEIQG
ncbi:hypothetical protein HXX76_000158 [Chlamydomonas incerta]|uniref:Uncharacterized protein n=2 Tax=Chlamydomonas incerta TaxID=51695 RepID=A0A835WDT4_CHLIN|nr:hypothetical protein HXX76_000158 [Chlamydomonas incerta]|eukprot:KAG2445543.1 hypothetical protein HXX76_000158 [Chlamydomonas incerta]